MKLAFIVVMFACLWIYAESIWCPGGTTTNLVQKQWSIEDIANDVLIYNVCPGPDENSTYFYGDLKSHTIIATEKNTMVYDIVPLKDGNDCDQDNFYFVGSIGYNAVCRYTPTSDDNNIACFNPILKEKSIISKIVLKIKDSNFLYVVISTLKSAVFCELNFQSLEMQKCVQYSSIEIHSVIQSNSILLLGIDYSNLSLNSSLALIWTNGDSTKKSFISRISDLAKENILKVGGVYIKNGNVITCGIQTNNIYIIELKNEVDIQESYSLSKQFQNCNINNIDTDSNKFFMVISCNDMNSIIIKEPRNKPLMFQYSNKKNTEFVNNRIEIQSQTKRYIPIFKPFSSIHNLLSLKVYKDKLHLLVSSTMIRYTCAPNSVLSIKDFNLFPSFPCNNEFLRIYATSIPDYPATLNISQISTIPAVLEYKTNATALPSVPLWFGQSSCKINITNAEDLSLGDYCIVGCGLDESQSLTYSINGFAESDIEQMKIDKNNGIILSSLPNTWEGEEEYTFILNTELNDTVYQSLVILNIAQCKPGCKKCWRNLCNKCMYTEKGKNKDGSTICNINNYSLFFFIDIVILVTLFAIYILAIFKKNLWTVYIEACNYYHQLFLILLYVPCSFTTGSFIVTTMFTLYPNLMFLSFARLFSLNFSQPEFNGNKFGVSYFFFNNNPGIRYTLQSIIGIYTVLVIIIVSSKLCSKCIPQRIKLYANSIIRDNFTALLFGTIFFYVINDLLNINQNDEILSIIFRFCYYCLILILLLILADTILIILKSYTRKLFGCENNKMYTKVYFEGLRNYPSALLYYLLLFAKRMLYAFLFFTFLFILLFLEQISNYYFVLYYLCFLTFIMVVECLWMYNLIIICPFKSFSENRIAILNQFFILVICVCNIITLTPSFEKFNDSVINVMQYFHIVCFLPISYIIFILHYITIKIFYKKSTGDGSPRFWRQWNPNINFASEESFTPYMPIKPNRESADLS